MNESQETLAKPLPTIYSRGGEGGSKLKKRVIVLICLAVCFFPAFLQAEDDKRGHQPITTMEEVVVTATKTKEKRKDVPNSVIIIDRAGIKESAATSVGELLANQPGIDWRTRGNYGGAAQTVQFRGMDANATQVFVNGVSLISPSLGTADVSRIPLNNIERIEIVKGSGSLLYGSGAMGGTINIFTKRPHRDQLDLNATAGYGTQNTYQLSAEHGMFAYGDFGYYLTANCHETDGFRDNSDLVHNDVSLNLVLEKGDTLDISLYGDYINREFGMPGVKPPDSTQDYYIKGQKFYNSESAELLDRHEDDNAHLVLQAKGRPFERLGFNLKTDYTYMKSYNYNRRAMDGEGEKTWITNEVRGAEGNLDFTPFQGASLLLGAEYKDYGNRNEQVDLNDTGGEKPGTQTNNKYHLFTKAAFAEAHFRPSDFFKVQLGIRQENHSMFGHENIPRYGLIINPLTNTTVKINRGKHFRAPTPNDLFWPDDGLSKGNPNLKPETGWHTDVTLEQQFTNNIFMTVSYFDWDLKDKINWAEDPNQPSAWPGYNYFIPSNVDSYDAKGMELGTKIGPFFNSILSFNYTYLDAEEKRKGYAVRQALYSPNHQFKGEITYWHDSGLTVTTTVRYTDKRPYYGTTTGNVPEEYLPAYWTTDLKIEQRLLDHWILSLQGNNLFDKGYVTYLTDFTDQNTGTTTLSGYPGAGRSVFFSAAYEY